MALNKTTNQGFLISMDWFKVYSVGNHGVCPVFLEISCKFSILSQTTNGSAEKRHPVPVVVKQFLVGIHAGQFYGEIKLPTW